MLGCFGCNEQRAPSGTVPSAASAPPAGSVAVSVPLAYVGSAACHGCHAKEAKLFAGSDHDRAIEEPTPQSVLGDFSGTRFTHAGETTEFLRTEAGFAVRVTREGEKSRTFPVKYSFGVDPLQQYLVDVGQGRLQALPVAWDTRPKAAGGQRWFHLHADQKKLAPGDRLHWQGPAYNWNSMCADCHSTSVEQNYQRETDSYATRFAELDVACEACHGKGSRHIAWAEARKKAPGHSGPQGADDKGLVAALVKPAQRRWVFTEGAPIATLSGAAAKDAELDRCAQCHSRRSDLGPGDGDTFADRYRLALLEDGLYFADGQIHEEVFELGSFLQSKMYARGVVCSDCHEPHSLALRAEGNALCTQCHRSDHYDTQQHHFHEVGTPSALCVTCHMPARTYMSIDARRDHGFSVPHPRLSGQFGAPDVCLGCHKTWEPLWAESAILKNRWSSPAPAAPNEALWLARQGQPGAAQALLQLMRTAGAPAIQRASALAELANDPPPELARAIAAAVTDGDPLLRRTAAVAAHSIPPAERLALLRPLLDDPVRTVRVDVAEALLDAPSEGLSQAVLAKLRRVLAEYVASLEYGADHAEGLVRLAELARRSGDPANAERLLQTAIRKEPSFSAAHLNLADLYRERGEETRTREILKTGLATASDRAMLEHALGLALIRAKQPQSALTHLRAAYEAAPDRPRLGYVYAIALFDTGDPVRALQVLTKLHELRPGDRQVLTSLVDYSYRSNRADKAKVYEQKLAALSGKATPAAP